MLNTKRKTLHIHNTGASFVDSLKKIIITKLNNYCSKEEVQFGNDDKYKLFSTNNKLIIFL